MRRQNIQLLAAVRQGDIAARCEVGRRYLCGIEGLPKHQATGLSYLTHPSVHGLARAAIVISENLPLDELMLTPQRDALRQAAHAGSAIAQLRLAAWEMTLPDRQSSALAWIEAAATAGNPIALHVVQTPPAQRATLPSMLRLLTRARVVDGGAVALVAARIACDEQDLPRLVHCLQAALDLAASVTPVLAELVGKAVMLAEDTGQPITLGDPETIQSCLEDLTRRDEPRAAYTLGRALAGIACGCLPANLLAPSPNLRKGAALLMRAADGGYAAAWMHLYRLHADRQTSVANPQMARFFLEKAAAAGQPVAQRKLGALELREATFLDATERAIRWLFRAASQDDAHALGLLRSLVLPTQGSDDDAAAVIDELQRSDPWLAQRLRLSRHFGLTKLEALTVDPRMGKRDWGLVVGRNPFIAQARLAAPRAVPAMTRRALEDLDAAAAFFGTAGHDAGGLEGDLRRRSQRQRSIFESRGIDDRLFFATATSTKLDGLRHGPKWALRSKDELRMALNG